MKLIRDKFGDIDIQETLKNIENDLILIKSNEVKSSEIVSAIQTVLNTYDSIIPKKLLISYVCNKISFNIEDYSKTIDKINLSINYLIEQKVIKYIPGRNGGITKC